MSFVDKLFGTPSAKALKKFDPTVKRVLALEDQYSAMSEQALRGTTAALKERLAAGEALDDILPDAFAACREASWRVLEMKHFPVQIMGGVVLHSGMISEMKTGEGKTLVATLPAYLNALAGSGVHIVTVNDYLARRDSEWMGKVYSYLGLSVGLVVNGLEPDERKKAYAADITYGTNNEFGFDYLRDNMVINKQSKVQRGHAYAIVDEVDSILIDEARTPLIISGPGDKSTDLYRRADAFAKTLSMTKITEHDDKTEMEELGGDVIIDEKARNCTLTKSGIDKAQRYFGVANLSDPENMTLSHHINQAIKARGIMHRDVDYVVRDGEVIIVDEFTGRLMIGRRYNEGLHQAIEAKENVHVARESKTLATITFQNYFRMYKKLAGMTGTALTEADEFREIYGLEVVEIPTNRPMIREDNDDVVYTTEAGKFRAVIEQVVECHAKNQPVLVGTISIEKSEALGKLLSRRGIKHEVLNAKYHDKEAAIVAQAGKPGAVTIATNMAGRGTDIILGGNADFLARSEMLKAGRTEEEISAATSYYATEDAGVLALRAEYTGFVNKFKPEIQKGAEAVRAAGGLYIIGTERHESRRIDNQLRGRAGRQGDPGASRFYLSLDDDLMRLFGGERLTNIMNTLRVDDDMPIQNKMLTNVIESSQKRVEGRNFSIRKSVLNYDDVMNHQRETIYSQRDMVLNGENIRDRIIDMLNESIENSVGAFLSDEGDHRDWNIDGLRSHYLGWLTEDTDLRIPREELPNYSREDIIKLLQDKALTKYEAKEKRLGDDNMRTLERLVMLRVVDMKWMDHIDDMDQLRKSIHLRSYAQKNPVVEYRLEGYNMFDDMIAAIREDTARLMLTAELVTASLNAKKTAEGAQSAGGDDSVKRQPERKKGKIGRNDPCPCGSGKKYKNCCGRNQ
ncbi:MAG: preprotein translocase subunit SecA [Oscillospiraceae bacterium]|nr:preprotein translocase subunit SecA [Oscillospiraceae bacterium]